MAHQFSFETKTWGRPGYTVLEGSASLGSQQAEFFLVVGETHASLDIQSLRGFSDQFVEVLAPVLGSPHTGPAVVNIGELMDGLDEAPVNVTWSFPPARRAGLLRALEALLGERAARPNQGGNSSGR